MLMNGAYFETSKCYNFGEIVTKLSPFVAAITFYWNTLSLILQSQEHDKKNAHYTNGSPMCFELMMCI